MKSLLRGLEGDDSTQAMFSTAAEAVVAGILDVQKSGGGVVWVHRPDCDGFTVGDACPCDPVPIEVEPKEMN